MLCGTTNIYVVRRQTVNPRSVLDTVHIAMYNEYVAEVILPSIQNITEIC